MTDPRSSDPFAGPRAGHADGALTVFQIEVAREFLGLPAAHGFLLAGGAALAAQGLTCRPTRDLDLFTSPGRTDVRQALAAFTARAAERGWHVEPVCESDAFVRAVVRGDGDAVLVDLAVDATPRRPPAATFLGPALDPDELAGRKLLALFDRAEARDFADVYALAKPYGTERLVELAAGADAGFDLDVLADMIDSLARFTDQEIPVPADIDVSALREFFHRWSTHLRARRR